MKLTELVMNQKLTIQLLWNDQKIEFVSNIIDKDDEGIYINPYMHKDNALDINITKNDKIICNVFTNLQETNRRISWKGVELKTEVRNNKKVYYIFTKVYNNMSKTDDRRQHDRVRVHKKGQVFDQGSGKYSDVMVHDISDIGVSFYASPTFEPTSHHLTVLFDDNAGDNFFNLKTDCSVTRTQNKNGMVFYGCKTRGENKDFLLYCFLKRLDSKKSV